MEPYETGICTDMFWKEIRQAYIICLSKSVIFPSTKWSFAIKTWNCPSKNADFLQILPRSSASVLMPLWQHLRPLRPVRCSRLAVMGRSWWVDLGWIRGNYKNSKNCQDSKDYGIILSYTMLYCFFWTWMDWYGLVCMYMGMCPFSAWFRHGFGGLVWFQTVPWVCTCFFVHLRWIRY